MGSFMILKMSKNVDEVMEVFAWASEDMVESFRDVTSGPSTFDLTLEDCWRALDYGKCLGWIACPTDDPAMWGRIDMEYYKHYDNPLDADLHFVVPDKLVAFRGPRDLDGRQYLDTKNRTRVFAPSHFVEIFEELGVTDVVRLNEPLYKPDTFESAGISVHELEFEDCTCPTDDIVWRFMCIVDGAKGAIAVHCRAGLGRTGTLIALYMMRVHGFSAREAMGWLRIMRPGSVIGEQQQYLCHMEKKILKDFSEQSRLDLDANHDAHLVSPPSQSIRSTTATTILASNLSESSYLPHERSELAVVSSTHSRSSPTTSFLRHELYARSFTIAASELPRLSSATERLPSALSHGVAQVAVVAEQVAAASDQRVSLRIAKARKPQ